MAEVSTKLQEPRRIAGADHATRRQRRSHLRTSTSSRISCKTSINSASRTAAQLQAYIEACQAADELRDAQFPHGGPALNHRPPDSELKTILLDALSTSRLGAYKNLYQQYCNRSHNGKTYTDLYNDIHDLVKYDSDGVT